MTRTQTHQPLVGTAHGVRILGDGSLDALEDAPITSIHSDGDDLWVLVSRRELHRVAHGATDLVARLDEAIGTCVGTHRGEVWVGGHDARLWRLFGDSLEEVESFQHAPTHDAWHTPWGGPPDVFSIASDGTNLYVSVHVGGILRYEYAAANLCLVDGGQLRRARNVEYPQSETPVELSESNCVVRVCALHDNIAAAGPSCAQGHQSHA